MPLDLCGDFESGVGFYEVRVPLSIFGGIEMRVLFYVKALRNYPESLQIYA